MERRKERAAKPGTKKSSYRFNRAQANCQIGEIQEGLCKKKRLNKEAISSALEDGSTAYRRLCRNEGAVVTARASFIHRTHGSYLIPSNPNALHLYANTDGPRSNPATATISLT